MLQRKDSLDICRMTRIEVLYKIVHMKIERNWGNEKEVFPSKKQRIYDQMAIFASSTVNHLPEVMESRLFQMILFESQ